MGFFDSVCELLEAATPWSSTVEAEAPTRGGAGDEKTPANDGGEGEGEAEDESEPTPDKKSDDDDQVSGKEASGNDGGDAKEDGEEEEEEEEIVDPREKLVEECENSKSCAPSKHHFDECVERVTAAEEANEGKAASKKHPNEDCVEEFFHLAHCANQCAAPKLWAQLK